MTEMTPTKVAEGSLVADGNVISTGNRGNGQQSTENDLGKWGFGARVFLEFDVPRLVETIRDAALHMTDSMGSGMGSHSVRAVFSSQLLHGAAACREIDDLF